MCHLCYCAEIIKKAHHPNGLTQLKSFKFCWQNGRHRQVFFHKRYRQHWPSSFSQFPSPFLSWWLSFVMVTNSDKWDSESLHHQSQHFNIRLPCVIPFAVSWQDFWNGSICFVSKSWIFVWWLRDHFPLSRGYCASSDIDCFHYSSHLKRK